MAWPFFYARKYSAPSAAVIMVNGARSKSFLVAEAVRYLLGMAAEYLDAA